MNQELCPCCSGKTYEVCCAPYLTGATKPSLPEQLMRSRYAAFYQGNIDYLIATHHLSKHQADDRQSLAQTSNETEWLSLRVLNADAKTVEFVAFYRDKGASGVSQLHEKSEFIFQNGQWYYLQGTMLPSIKIERNDPCWCGSGKKFKKCHGT